MNRVRNSLSTYEDRNRDCSQEESTAVRIENIPASASLAEIFLTIWEGKIVLFSKQPANHAREIFACAARLVFQTRAAAERFISRTNSDGGIVLHNHRFAVKWDRHLAKPFEPPRMHQYRF